MGAYIKSGTTSGSEAVGAGDPKKIFLKAGAAVARLILKSNGDAKTELDLSVPANTSFYLKSDGHADRFPMGRDLTATITGDTATFVRIDF